MGSNKFTVASLSRLLGVLEEVWRIEGASSTWLPFEVNFLEVFDVNTSAHEDAASDVHENTKPSTTHVNPLAINKSSSAAQQNRPVGTGHVIARLPPNHPLLLAATSGSTVSSGSPLKGKQLKAPFTMRPSMMYRVARRVCPKSLLNLRFAARRPMHEINLAAVKNYCE
ncbi:hypothetical protein NECAME_11462 [Necator americanus]|uniref:Metastasis-associated protein MTA1 R1 domain-containing protein n=1 Tax=Necator americanus TaxID=51031 RepID=W2T720_NECAM|nr:hypothetical protein NECAME_11462 [Necator americanus]ETN76772.1 hypothetical protein NECAME_11462 [Necator americanus]